MKVVVTGSSGFIGSALISSLRADGVKTHGIDIRLPRWREPHPDDHHVDMNDGTALEACLIRLKPDQIVHLAARTDISADSVVKYNVNIDGVTNLAHAAHRAESVRRVLWTSSQLVSRVGRIPTHDTDYEPDTSYGESKVITERIVRGLDGCSMEWAILRPTTVWGPGMSDHYLSLLRYLESGRYFHAGGTRTLKSFSYIYNAVHQIRGLMQAPASQIHRTTFYIADDKPIDMRSWCDALSAELGARASPVVPVAAARILACTGDVLNATIAPNFKFNSFRLHNILTPYVFNTDNLQAVVGPLPNDEASAIKQTVAWYRNVAKSGPEQHT
ncbi:MAG: NAD(P)-dependent oxidoreductase [Pseudomonadota bacterium]